MVMENSEYKKTLKLAVKTLKLISFLNILTFGIFKDRLNYQSELVINLVKKSLNSK